MKRNFSILFLCLTFSILAQQNKAEKNIYISMDKTASILMEKSKANSISIGVVKMERPTLDITEKLIKEKRTLPITIRFLK